MKVLSNVELKQYTTIRIGGITKRMYIPETPKELFQLVKNEESNLLLGGGSNLLINQRLFESVINLRSFDTSITHEGNGSFLVGASARLQRLIDMINDIGYGGIEYLYSVPGLVGGAVVMNAGRGKTYNLSISDYIDYVNVIHNGEILRMNKFDCRFAYRDSLFKNSDYVVLSVKMTFPQTSREESKKAKEERKKKCKELQDNTYPNFGSVFKLSDPTIMKCAKAIRLGNKRVHFSSKTSNWLSNAGNGSFDDAIAAIKKIEFLHKIAHKKCEREVIVWD